jgi:hypothetical protein
MDMTEEQEDDNRALRQRQLSFKLVESQMFSAFDGSWTIRYHSRSREFNTVLKKYVYVYKTKLTYTVSVKPKVQKFTTFTATHRTNELRIISSSFRVRCP